MADTTDLILEEMPRLRRFARYLTRDAADADDLVQDCLATAIAKIHLYTPNTNLRAWLFTIQRNIHITNMRRAKRAPLVATLEDNPSAARSRPRQEEALIIRDVEDAMGHLSDDHRSVLVTVAMQGLSYEDAAEALNVPVGTIRSRLSRARDALLWRLDPAAGRDGGATAPAQQSMLVA